LRWTILPEPVVRNRFFAPECVFIFGMVMPLLTCRRPARAGRSRFSSCVVAPTILLSSHANASVSTPRRMAAPAPAGGSRPTVP